MQFVNSLRVLAVFATAISVFLPASSFADPGDLDTSFQGTGILLDDLNNSPLNFANDMLLQPDGKIVVAGSRNGKFAVVRYNSDGSRDDTFGTDGLVQDERVLLLTNTKAKKVGLQPDGGIVIAGEQAIVGQDVIPILARFDAQGELDTQFGTAGGIVFVNALVGESFVASLAVQSDGKLLVGIEDDDSSTDSALSRFNPDGTADNTFVASVSNNTIIFNGEFTEGIEGVVQQGDGKILFFGRNAGHAVFARINADATPDTSFGGDGFVDLFTNDDNNMNDIALQDDGKIVAVGQEKVSNSDMLVVRLNSDGSFDNSFSGNGFIAISFGGNQDFAGAVTLSDIGMIFASGPVNISLFGGNNFMGVAKLNPDGSLDQTYGTGGKATVSFPDRVQAASGMALQSDGKVLIAGTVDDAVLPDDERFSVARLEGNTANLTIQKTANGGDFDVGDEITFQIVVTNQGPNSTGNAVVTDILDPALTLQSVSTSQGTCSGTGSVVCTLGVLQNGEQVTVTLVATAQELGDILNTATVTAGQVQDDNADNSASFTVSVNGGGGGGGGCILSTTVSSPDWRFAAFLLAVGLFTVSGMRRHAQQ